MFLTETLAYATPTSPPTTAYLNVATFPVIELTEVRFAGYAFAWCAAMRDVLARSEPFILLDLCAKALETDEDRQARRCWLASNVVLLQQWCKGYITVEPDIAHRGEARAAVLGLFGQSRLRVMVVSNVTVAKQLALVLLKTDNQPSTRLTPTFPPRRRRI